MRIHRFWTLGLLAALLSAAVAPVAFAQQESPPTRVGRLSYIGGSVSFEPAGTQQWAKAELNRPVTIGDRIWTDWDSRAEIELGDAVVRLGSRTGFSFLNLTAMTAQMQLTAGTLIVHVRTLASGEHDEVDTPNLALWLEQPGTYRVHVNASGDTTRVEVVSGEALASGGGQTFPVAAQQSATFTGTETLSVVYASVGMPDALDDWSMARDRQEAHAAAEVTNYVSPDMVGIYDLDTYGSWEQTPEWGYAWFPNVVVGWAPYRFGHWVWIFPWGWTWVDDEPWGFAPFHYGRWAHWHNAWCWVPGRRDVRPVYAPALVAWMHGRHRRGRHIGWVPLGPRDVYLPGYAASRAYVRDVNLANARDLSPRAVNAAFRHGGAGLTYGNRRIPGAITAVSRTAFSGSKHADAHRVALTRRGVLTARLTSEAPAITPSRTSVFGARMRTMNVPPRQLTNRPVVARRLPARAAVSFARQQAAIRANSGRPLTMAQWARYRPNRPAAAVRMAPHVRAPAPALRRGGMRSHFTNRGAPIRAPAQRARPAPQQPSRLQGPARYRADRPGWAQSPNGRRNRSAERPRSPVPPSNAARRTEQFRNARPQQPLPERHVPRPQYRAPAYRRANPPPAQPVPQRHVPRPQYRAPARRPVNPTPRSRPTPNRRPPFAAITRWHAAAPRYRVQQISAPVRSRPTFAIHNNYVAPRSPPPTYRPVAPRFTPHPSLAPPPPAYHPARAQAVHVWRPHPLPRG